MCGRFALTAPPAHTTSFLGLGDIEDFPPRYNIAPTQPILMALASEPRAPGSNLPDRQAMLVRWGLIPTWVKDTKAFPLLFNARSEGVAEKASFRTAMRHRRALIPASGFYEWQQTGPSKGQAYWIRPRSGGLVAFAGLMETYAEPGGSEMDTGAILTTSANPDIASIHPRMPVVIEPEHFSRWLDCRTQEPREVMDLLRPAEEGFFEAVPVASLVNKVVNTGPELQDRVEIDRLVPEKSRRGKPDDGQMTLF